MPHARIRPEESIRTSRFAEEQLVAVLKESKAGTPIAVLALAVLPGGPQGGASSPLEPPPQAPPLIFVGDFESEERGVARLGTADLEGALQRVSLVTAPRRAGEYALEVRLDRASGEHRTDFYVTNIGGRFRIGQEYWFGFSVWFPDEWEPDTQNELFVQWVRTTKEPAGPQLAFYLNGPDCVIRKRWDPDPDDGEQQVRSENLWRGSVLEDRGDWTDWVVHVRWAKDETGLVEVWKNGERVMRDQGPNCYDDGDDRAPYFKFGLYKWPWQKPPEEAPSTVTARRLVFDEIRIGDAQADLAAVSARGPRR